MSGGVNTEYCSFTKAVEHLGDRWCLLILRELAMQGPQGFNVLAAAIPGHISRSVLTERLHRLSDLGIVSRPSVASRAPYALTEAGRGLIPAMMALRSWADGWLPEDPAAVERDPEIVLGWLAERVAITDLPERRVVVELRLHYRDRLRSWLVLEAGSEPYGCLEDPLLDEARYVYVEAGLPVLVSIARGRRDWAEALVDGSLQADGDPALVERLPSWFMAAEPAVAPGSAPAPTRVEVR
ncbi:MAG: helix-turn-helix domain-containing protein [Candidatus Limnocylindrales bacterium]